MVGHYGHVQTVTMEKPFPGRRFAVMAELQGMGQRAWTDGKSSLG